MGLTGACSFPNMLRSSAKDDPEVDQSVNQFRVPEDVKIYGHLPDYDDFHCLIYSEIRS